MNVASTDSTCLTCERPPLRRGLCHRCYQACAAQVRRKAITWEEAEKLDLARSPREHGPWMVGFQKVKSTNGDIGREESVSASPNGTVAEATVTEGTGKKIDRRGGALPNQLRWGTISQAELEEKAAILEKVATALRSSKNAMSDLDVDDIRLDSVTKFDRGTKLLNAYMEKVEMAVIAAKYGQ